MAETLVLKRKRYIPASDIENLDVYKEYTFVIERHGVISYHKLKDIRRSKVKLSHVGDRTDEFTISKAEFLKFYKLPVSKDQ